MDIQYKISNETLKILISGELDEYSASFARTILDDLFQNNEYSQIVIDLSKLEFMDSTGIGVLIGRYKKLKEKQKNIYIMNPNKHIEKIFKMSGLYEIMPKIG